MAVLSYTVNRNTSSASDLRFAIEQVKTYIARANHALKNYDLSAGLRSEWEAHKAVLEADLADLEEMQADRAAKHVGSDTALEKALLVQFGARADIHARTEAVKRFDWEQ